MERSAPVREIATGVLVTVAAIPLGIGLAEVAGVPPAAGLYTCIWPLIVFAVVGSSPHLKLGMDASSAALIAATVPALVADTPQEYLAVAGALTLLTGVFVLAAGLLRLGVLADLLSLPVLIGYTAGIAASVVISQLPTMLGYDVDGSNSLAELVDILTNLGSTQVVTAAVAAIALLFLVALRRALPAWPTAALVLVGGLLLSWALDLEAHGVAVVGAIPSGLPVPVWPDVPLSRLTELLAPAAGVALVVAADTVITSRSFASRLGYQVSANRDLAGLGAANLASAVTGGVVASASYSRTAIAVRNGSRSQLSGVVAAVVMAGVLLALTGALSATPLALLAAIVVDAVARLVDPRELARLLRVRHIEAAIAVLTTAGVLTVGLLPTIALAVGASLLLALADLARAWRRHEEDPTHPRLGRFSPNQTGDPTTRGFAWHGPIVFVNAGRFREAVIAATAIEDGIPVQRVVMDARDVTAVDATAADLLAELGTELTHRGAELEVVGLRAPYAARVARSRPPHA